MMIGALFKKQLMEINTRLFRNKKSGTKHSAAIMVLLGILYAAIVISLGFVFFFVGVSLCQPLAEVGLSWLYFSLMGLISIALGVFGSVFNTYATLYKAKDNDLLLSLPIPPSYILAVRLFGVWIWGLVYESIVFIPALVAYRITVEAGWGQLLSAIALLLLLSVFILTLSCILGWVVAKISGRLKNKNAAIVLLSLAFIAAYYYFYSRAYSFLQSIIANAAVIGERIRGAAYPLYLTGRAGDGDALSMLLILLIVAAFFGLVCFVLCRTFLSLATSSDAAKRVKYNGETGAVRSADTALLVKEAKRFASSSVYMLNCGLGTVFMVFIGVFSIVKADMLREAAASLGPLVSESFIALVGCAGVCAASSINYITAPSVSLEGKNLWIVQSLPIDGWQALKAKLKLHLLITGPAAAFCSVCFILAMHLNAADGALVVVVPMLFVLFCACLGLALNLKVPNLEWKNETVPVKQSLPVLLSMLGGWIIVIVLGVLYFMLSGIITVRMYLAACALLFALLSAALLAWLRTRGARIFSAL